MSSSSVTMASSPGGRPPANGSGRKESGRKGPWLPHYLVLACIWGSSFLFIKQGLESLTPVGVAFWRLALGALALVTISLVARSSIPPRRTWKHLFVLALLTNAVPFLLFAYGETQVSSIVAGIINAVTPLTTLSVLLLAFPEERPTRERIAGLLVGFVGVVIVLGAWRDVGAGEWRGTLACLLAVCCYGVSFPYSRRYLLATGAQPIALATGQVTLAALQLLPVAIISGTTAGAIDVGPALSMVALGCLGSGVAFILNFHIIRVAGSSTASTVTYLTPLVAVVLGVLFLDESLHWNQPVGAVVVLLGAATAQGVVRRLGRRAFPEATVTGDASAATEG